MFLRPIDLTSALRPDLQPEETLLSVHDAVGLYRDRYKIDDLQDGHVYLTSHRLCYVDDVNPRQKSVGIGLKDVDFVELSAGFLRSSPKVSLHPKELRRHALPLRGSYSETSSPASHSRREITTQLRLNATWICPICSFSNPVPATLDPATANANTVILPCSACGIKPPLLLLIKAAIAAMSQQNLVSSREPIPVATVSSISLTETGVCPRCTFQNHESLRVCEMCGSSLDRQLGSRPTDHRISGPLRSDSPAPTLSSAAASDTGTDVIKFSFRAGGEKVLLDRLKHALTQRKWLLHNAPPVPGRQVDDLLNDDASATRSNSSQPRRVGIAGLETRGVELHKTNEFVIGSAFEDLEALITSAKEVIAMAERFRVRNGLSEMDDSTASEIWSESASALGLVTTKDMVPTGSSADTLYVTQLARDLAEYLTDDKRGILRREGGIISLVDLWAVFNRSRNGIELVSPLDFEKAARMWESLQLPLRLRKFKSGLLVVQGKDRTDEKTIKVITNWLDNMRLITSDDDAQSMQDSIHFGKGVTAQDTAAQFKWSVGVAAEELEMAEQCGALVRDQCSQGLKFWLNNFSIFETTASFGNSNQIDAA